MGRARPQMDENSGHFFLVDSRSPSHLHADESYCNTGGITKSAARPQILTSSSIWRGAVDSSCSESTSLAGTVSQWYEMRGPSTIFSARSCISRPSASVTQKQARYHIRLQYQLDFVRICKIFVSFFMLLSNLWYLLWCVWDKSRSVLSRHIQNNIKLASTRTFFPCSYEEPRSREHIVTRTCSGMGNLFLFLFSLVK